MCDGLRFVKTLRIGPMKPEMIELFDRLISRLRDHSLVDFKWDIDDPPLNSQLVYIWDHQWNIQSIYLTRGAVTVKSIQPWKGLKFPQKYVHISLDLPLEDTILAKLDLSCLRTLTVGSYCRNGLPLCISANMVHITNLELHYVSFYEMDIQLDRMSSLVSLKIHFCVGTSSVLSNFRNPNLKEFRVQFGWNVYEDEDSLDEDFLAQFSFIKRFQGLETLVVDMPDQRHHCLKDLIDAISVAHNDTLRNLALLDACALGDSFRYIYDSEWCTDSVYDALMACPRLVQVELPTGWRRKEKDFKVCYIFNLQPLAIINGNQRIIDNLPSLKFLFLRLHLPWGQLSEICFENKLPVGINDMETAEVVTRQVATSLIRSIKDNPSSKLRLLGFDIRGYPPLLCFTRGWSHGSPLVPDCPSQISERHVKYHLPEYDPIPY